MRLAAIVAICLTGTVAVGCASSRAYNLNGGKSPLDHAEYGLGTTTTASLDASEGQPAPFVPAASVSTVTAVPGNVLT